MLSSWLRLAGVGERLTLPDDDVVADVQPDRPAELRGLVFADTSARAAAYALEPSRSRIALSSPDQGLCR